jgi:hypothetical protein
MMCVSVSVDACMRAEQAAIVSKVQVPGFDNRPVPIRCVIMYGVCVCEILGHEKLSLCLRNVGNHNLKPFKISKFLFVCEVTCGEVYETS